MDLVFIQLMRVKISRFLIWSFELLYLWFNTRVANLVYDQLVYDLTQPISLRPYAMDWLRYGRFKSWCKGAVQMFMEETGNEF